MTDVGPTIDAAPDALGDLRIPFLLGAENIDYVFPRGVRKIGGTLQLNSSVIGSSTTTITGMMDYWRQGTSGAPTRRRVCHAGTQIYRDTDDFSFTSLATGLEDGVIPHYSTFDDFLIIGSSSTVDVPRSWDQTTFQNLAGTPPRFSFSVPHKNRQFAAGVYTAPSTLYYSANLDPEDWAGAGSGSISIDPNDGDMITGIASYKNDLLVFKGPYKGSIHRITGSTPSDYARTTFITGITAAWQNTIVPFGDDLAWVSPVGTFHSLKATSAYGDYNQAFLSQPIARWINTYLSKSRLKYCWAVNDTLNGRLLFALSRAVSQYNDLILSYDYRFQDPPFNTGRWALRTAHNAASLSYFVEGGLGSERRVYAGGTDGYLRRIDEIGRSVDGSTAYTAKVTLPTCTYGGAWKTKTLEGVGLSQTPKGNYTATLGWSRDGKAQQTTTLSMSGGDTLGSDFTWGSSPWGGYAFTHKYMTPEEGGEFRGIQYQLQKGTANQDMEVFDIHAKVSFGGESLED